MDAPTSPIATARTLSHSETRLVILGVLLPTFMGSLDQTILAAALPTIGRDFADAHNLPWLITAYLIAATAVIPLYGKIADIRGRLFSLRIAILCYMAGSLICALAPNMVVLILGRLVHGIGGGGLTSIGMIVLGDIAAPKERGRYYVYFSLAYTTAGATGPVLGGMIAQYLHWSMIFWMNLPLGALAFTFTVLFLPRLPRFERPHRLDVIGALLIVSASVSFMLALNQGGVRYAWGSWPIVTLFIVAAAMGILFVARLLTAPEPLIPIAILANPEARLSIIANAFAWAPIIGINIFLPTYLQTVIGLSPTTAGLSLVALMVTLNTSAAASGQLLGRVKHYKLVPMLGLALATGALLALGWRAGQASIVEFELLIMLLGLGFGPLPPVTSVVLQNSVAIHQFGTAVGVQNFARNLYATVIVAAFGAIALTGGSFAHGGGAGPAALASAEHSAGRFSLVFFAAAFSVSVALISLWVLTEKPLGTDEPDV